MQQIGIFSDKMDKDGGATGDVVQYSSFSRRATSRSKLTMLYWRWTHVARVLRRYRCSIQAVSRRYTH